MVAAAVDEEHALFVLDDVRHGDGQVVPPHWPVLDRRCT